MLQPLDRGFPFMGFFFHETTFERRQWKLPKRDKSKQWVTPRCRGLKLPRGERTKVVSEGSQNNASRPLVRPKANREVTGINSVCISLLCVIDG